MRLIDADALDLAFTELRWCKLPGAKEDTLAHWGDRKDWCLHGSEIEKLIADAPTVDAVPVVRCKDCRWRHDDSNPMWLPCMEIMPRDDWFCAYGERKEGGRYEAD